MKVLVSSFVALTLFGSALSQTPRIVTATQANGTYDYRQNEIKILALGHNKLRIQMELIYRVQVPSRPNGQHRRSVW